MTSTPIYDELTTELGEPNPPAIPTFDELTPEPIAPAPATTDPDDDPHTTEPEP